MITLLLCVCTCHEREKAMYDHVCVYELKNKIPDYAFDVIGNFPYHFAAYVVR